MKKIFGFLIFIVVILAVLVLARNVIAKTAVEGGVKAVTGLNLSIGKFNLGLDSSLAIHELKLENPAGFEEKTMVDLPKVGVAVDLPSVFKGKVHVKNIDLYLREFSVIKNKDGVLNLDSLKVMEETKKDPAKKEDKPKKEGKPAEIQIDRISLRVDKVVFRDYSKPIAIKKDFNVNINEEWTDVTDPNELVKAIVFKTLRNTTIGSLANVNLDAFSDAGKAALDKGKQLAGEAQAQAKAQAKAALEQVKKVELDKVQKLGSSGIEGSKEMAAKAEESLKGAAGSLKDTSKNLFGSIKATVGGAEAKS